MKRYVADTHALFWYLAASPKLSRSAKQAFDESANGLAKIYIPAIVLAELHLLNRKLGQPLNFSQTYHYLRQSGQFVLLPLEPEVVLDFDEFAAIPDIHDRIIAITTRRLQATCLSADGEITRSGLVPVLW